MNKRTRYFMLGSSAVLVAGLSIGVVAYYGGLPVGVLGASAGPAELRYVPKDASVVAYANVREVMASQVRQRVRQFEPNPNKGQREFQEQTGINIETDIDHVVACVVPNGDKTGHSNGFVAAKGQFNEVKIEGLIREHGGQVEQYHGKRLLIHEQKHAKSGEPVDMAVAFAEPGVVLLGSTAAVRQAIDRSGKPTEASVTSNDDMMRQIHDLEPNSVWAVGRFDAIASQAKLPEDMAARIPPITWFSASGHVNGGITGMLRAEARDDEGAKNLRDIVQGFLALAKLQAGSRPELQAILPNLQLSGSGKLVTLSFTVPTQVFDAFTPKKQAGKH